MMLLFGCEAATRTRVLSFFFDDAPKPEDQKSPAVIAQAGAGTDAKNKDVQPQKAFKHGPFGARLCSACHDPNTNALLLPKNKLCFKCHEVPTKTRRQHGPVASGGCLVCHEPHSGSSEALLVDLEALLDFLKCHSRPLSRVTPDRQFDSAKDISWQRLLPFPARSGFRIF